MLNYMSENKSRVSRGPAAVSAQAVRQVVFSSLSILYFHIMFII